LIHQAAISRGCNVSFSIQAKGFCCAALRKVITGHLTHNTSARVFGHWVSKLRDIAPNIWRNIYDICYIMKL